MPSKLEKITEGLDLLWEDEIYDPCTALPTLFEVDNIDARWLPFLKALLGFTAEIPFDATEEELRRVLRVAVPYWNKKPTEEGVIETAIRMVTGNRFRAGNYFDFRSQTDVTVITEELEDFDPSVIAFFAPLGAYPSGNPIRLGLPTADGFNLLDQYAMASEDVEAYLVISNDPGSPSNDGFYPIVFVAASGESGRVDRPFPRAGTSIAADWKILFFMDEFITEARLVDPGRGDLSYDGLAVAWTVGEVVYGGWSGAHGVIVSDDGSTLDLRSLFGRFENNEPLIGSLGGAATAKGALSGVLNRTLLAYLIGQVLPGSERVNVVYINFLDQFITAHDLDQWSVSDPDAVVNPGGSAFVPGGETMIDADPEAEFWGDQTTAWKFTAVGATSVARCVFMADTLADCYFAQVDYGAKDLKLFKRASGTPTQIGSTVSLSTFLKHGVQDTVRVDALAEGANTRIRVKVDGETYLDELDTPATRTAGHIGFEAGLDTCSLQMAEVNVLPTEIQRVGLNP